MDHGVSEEYSEEGYEKKDAKCGIESKNM